MDTTQATRSVIVMQKRSVMHVVVGELSFAGGIIFSSLVWNGAAAVGVLTWITIYANFAKMF